MAFSVLFISHLNEAELEPFSGCVGGVGSVLRLLSHVRFDLPPYLHVQDRDRTGLYAREGGFLKVVARSTCYTTHVCMR